MKKIKIIYWIFTILFALSMLSTAIPELIGAANGAKFMAAIGYPMSINAFLGIAKLLGIIAILLPGWPRIKEWAYAGFTFDLLGATYAMIAAGLPVSNWVFMIIFFVLLIGSYVFYHKKLKAIG